MLSLCLSGCYIWYVRLNPTRLYWNIGSIIPNFRIVCDRCLDFAVRFMFEISKIHAEAEKEKSRETEQQATTSEVDQKKEK